MSARPLGGEVLRWFVRWYYAGQRVRARWQWKRRPAHSREGKPIQPESVRRLLLVNIGLIGDTVMCTPAIAEARRLFPQAHIMGLVTSHVRDLLDATPYFDEVIVFDHSPFPLRPAKRKALDALRLRIRETQVDLAIILLGDDFAPLLAEAGISYRVGVAGDELACFCTHLYDIGSPRTWGPDERLGALRVLGLAPRDQSPALSVAPADQERLLQKLGVSNLRREDLIVLHPFGSAHHQWWPLNEALRCAQLLVNHLGCRVAILGGPRERKVWELNHPDLSPSVIDVVGRLTLGEVCALIECAKLVITTDSGPLHIAGALRRPTIGLFRARRPEHAFRYPSVIPLFGDEANAHCGGCAWDRCQTLPCQQLVSFTAPHVLGVALERLQTAMSRA